MFNLCDFFIYLLLETYNYTCHVGTHLFHLLSAREYSAWPKKSFYYVGNLSIYSCHHIGDSHIADFRQFGIGRVGKIPFLFYKEVLIYDSLCP